MGSEEIERFYNSLISSENIHGVIILKDAEILRTNLDEEKAKKFIEFADEILKRAEKSLKRLPELTGEINFVSIFLQNNLVVLISVYGSYKLVVVARVEDTSVEEIKEMMRKVKETLE